MQGVYLLLSFECEPLVKKIVSMYDAYFAETVFPPVGFRLVAF